MVNKKTGQSQKTGPEFPLGPDNGHDGKGTPQSGSAAAQGFDKKNTQTLGHTDDMETAGLSQPGKWSAGLRRAWDWKPKPARYDPENPPKFTIWLNMLFGFVSHRPFSSSSYIY